MALTASPSFQPDIDVALIDRLHSQACKALAATQEPSELVLANDNYVNVSGFRVTGRVNRAIFRTSRTNAFQNDSDDDTAEMTGKIARKGHIRAAINIFTLI